MNDITIAYGGPEQLFGVADLRIDGAVARGSLILDGRHGATGGRAHAGAGALAVLVDDVLGYAAVAAGPTGPWSVSTDITIDMVSPGHPGERLLAEARALHADDALSLTECSVYGDDGRLVAVASQRGRFTHIRSGDLDAAGSDPSAISDAIARGRESGTAALIGCHLVAQPAERLPVAELSARPELGNRLGALHGGVALAASLIEAEAVLAELGSDALNPVSIRITYPRPIGPGTDVRFAASVRHIGRSFAVLDIAGEADGRLCTSAQVTAHPSARVT